MSEKTYIDMSSYKRKDHFEYFRSLAVPHMGVTVDVDVTNIVTICRQKNVSFYLTFMHLVALAANSIPEFRQRIEGDCIAEYDECKTSHTEDVGDGTYRYCTLRHDCSFDEYISYAEKERQKCKEGRGLTEDEDVDSMFFISTLPWFKYSNLIQPTAGKDDSNPRFTWGAYEKDYKDRLMMPVTVLCNHALVDGSHLAAFYDKLNKLVGDFYY